MKKTRRARPIRYQAIFFDFDGVLVESTEIKTRAFQTLYQGHGQDVIDAVVAHHIAHEGISRVEKIRHGHSSLLGIDLDDKELAELAEQYSALVVDAVVACVEVTGAREFLEDVYEKLPIFVVSGTPEPELIDIVERRGMRRFFTSVHGSPRHKTPIILDLLQDHGLDGSRCLFVGDAMTDYNAAMQTSIPFIGRVAKGGANPFPSGTTIIRDLTALSV